MLPADELRLSSSFTWNRLVITWNIRYNFGLPLYKEDVEKVETTLWRTPKDRRAVVLDLRAEIEKTGFVETSKKEASRTLQLGRG